MSSQGTKNGKTVTEVIMNRTYQNHQYESNCRFVRVEPSHNDSSILDLIGGAIAAITSARVINIIKVVLALACFFGFIGVMGGVESGSVSLGLGVVISAFMIFVEILCFAPKKQG